MSKGYRLTFKATLPANADDPASLLEAQSIMKRAEEGLASLGFKDVTKASRYVNNITGPSAAPAVATAIEPAAPATEAVAVAII